MPKHCPPMLISTILLVCIVLSSGLRLTQYDTPTSVDNTVPEQVPIQEDDLTERVHQQNLDLDSDHSTCIALCTDPNRVSQCNLL